MDSRGKGGKTWECKGPEARLYMACVKENKETSVAESQRGERPVWGEG